jgi:hypothetical protein
MINKLLIMKEGEFIRMDILGLNALLKAVVNF